MENNRLGKLLTALVIDGIAITRIMIESILVRRAVSKNICLNILTAWNRMVSLKLINFFNTYFSITLIDKTDGKNPKKREDYWRRTLKTYSPFGLNVEDSV